MGTDLTPIPQAMTRVQNGMLFWHVPSEKGMCMWPCAHGTHGLSMCTSRKDPGTQGKKRIGISRSGGRVIVKTKVSKKGNEGRMEDGGTEELVFLRADYGYD